MLVMLKGIVMVQDEAKFHADMTCSCNHDLAVETS